MKKLLWLCIEIPSYHELFPVSLVTDNDALDLTAAFISEKHSNSRLSLTRKWLCFHGIMGNVLRNRTCRHGGSSCEHF